MAKERNWTAATELGAISMLPPSHAAADPHSLGAAFAAKCGGRAFRGMLTERRLPATVSHLEIYRTDSEHEVYDVVQWQLPEPWPARLEILVHADPWNHHKLTDRFDRATARKVSTRSGPSLRVSNLLDTERVERLTSHPALARLEAATADVRGGFAAEADGDQASVFTWSGAPIGGRVRYAALWTAAEAFDSLLASG